MSGTPGPRDRATGRKPAASRQGWTGELIPRSRRHLPPPAPQTRSRLRGRKALVGIAVAALALAAGIGWFLEPGVPDGAAGSGARPAPTIPAPPGAPDLAAPPSPGETEGVTDPLAPGLSAPELQAVLAAPPGEAAAPGAPVPGLVTAPAETIRPDRTALLVFDAGSGEDSGQPEAPAGEAGEPESVAVFPAAPRKAGTTRPAAAPAASAPANRRSAITKGTLIPAVLETVIDPARPGHVRAVVSADVRAWDGGRVLLARSSKLIGRYTSTMQGGIPRAVVVWTHLLRADGGSVSLPASGGGLESVIDGTVSSGMPRFRPGEPIRVHAARDIDIGGSR